MGRQLAFQTADAALEDFENEDVVVAGFDADQDGHNDVLAFVSWQTAVVYHGPFTGTIPSVTSGTADPSQVTWLGDWSGCMGGGRSHLLPDHLGPGHHAVTVGEAAWCNAPDTYIYDLMQPRGTRLGFDDAFATGTLGGPDDFRHFDDAGDLDGDGYTEVLWASTWGDRVVWKGPLSGPYLPYYAPEPGVALIENETFNNLTYAIGDLNGDGTTEFAGIYRPSGYEAQGWMVVAFSPYGDRIDLSQALPIGSLADLNEGWGDRSPDLDGDGLPDILYDHPYDTFSTPPNAGEVRIWYGKDLLAAWEALLAARD